MEQKSADHFIYAAAAVALILLAGFYVLQKNPPQPTFASLPPAPETPHRLGSAEAPIQLYVYFDTDCPYCERYHRVVMPALKERYGDNLATSYLYLPLPSHPKALGEARMAECAARIGGEVHFWPTVQWLLYSTMESTEPTENDLAALARFTSLPQTALATCLRDRTVDTLIRQNIEDGVLRGVSTIPSTLIVTKDASQLVATSREEVLLSAIADLYETSAE